LPQRRPLGSMLHRSSGCSRLIGNRGFLMDRYIHEQNLLNYRKVLSETTGLAKRRILLELLASEQTNVRPASKAT
jgi:hypothetical protein